MVAPCTCCTLGRVANTGGGIRDGVSCALGRVANGACQAFGGVAESVAHSANCNESIPGSQRGEERRGGG